VTHARCRLAPLVGEVDLGVACLLLAAVRDGLALRAHAGLEVGVGEEGVEGLDLGEAHGALELDVRLPVHGACSRGHLDVDDGVAELLRVEDLVQIIGPEDGLFKRCADVGVGEEDGHHVVARSHCEK